MGQKQSTPHQQQPAQRPVQTSASATEAPSAEPGSTVRVGSGSGSGRKLTYVSYEANSWQATFEQTGAF